MCIQKWNKNKWLRTEDVAQWKNTCLICARAWVWSSALSKTELVICIIFTVLVTSYIWIYGLPVMHYMMLMILYIKSNFNILIFLLKTAIVWYKMISVNHGSAMYITSPGWQSLRNALCLKARVFLARVRCHMSWVTASPRELLVCLRRPDQLLPTALPKLGTSRLLPHFRQLLPLPLCFQNPPKFRPRSSDSVLATLLHFL